jgi:hypothetical protein
VTAVAAVGEVYVPVDHPAGVLEQRYDKARQGPGILAYLRVHGAACIQATQLSQPAAGRNSG